MSHGTTSGAACDDVTEASDLSLVRTARADDPRDRERATTELAQRYTPLVRSLAHRHHRSGGPDHDDVVSIGNVGLLKAIRDFELGRGVPFAAYAKAKVRGEILRWFRDSRYALHVPRTLHETFMQVRQVQGSLTPVLGREPSVDEVAETLGIPSESVIEALAVNSAERARTAQLASTLHDHAVTAGFDLPEVELQSALAALDDRTRLVLHRRYWMGDSQREIGEDLGVSQAHVSRIELAGLRTLREHLGTATPAPVAA